MVFTWTVGENQDRKFKIDFENDSRRDINRALRDKRNSQLKEEHARVAREQAEQRRRRVRRPRTGSARLSNTDGMPRAQQVRSQLTSKMREVAASEMEPRARNALSADIQMQIDRVDQMITAIRRREQAVQAERARAANESDSARRRREHDMQERRIYIRRELLHHANDGGLNPNAPPFSMGGGYNPSMPVTLDIGGSVGSFDMPPMDIGGGGTEIVL